MERAGSTEVYGLVLWIASYIGLTMYLAWTFLPDSILHALGMYYYPSRYWALALPSVFCAFSLGGMVLYCGLMMRATEPMTSRNLISDSFALAAPRRAHVPGSVPPLYDSTSAVRACVRAHARA